MKRGLLLLLLFLLLPIVSATLEITGPTNSEYNIGDRIEFSGYAETSDDFSGILKFYLLCGSKTYNLQRFSVDLSSGERLLFSQLSMSSITSSSTMLGICKLKAELVSNDIVFDSAYSYNFEISNDLEGSFTLDKSSVMLGDEMTLTGTINKDNGDALDGTAEIYFNYNNEQYLMGFVDVVDGLFTYSTEMTATSPGIYYISLIARDSYGNQETFTKAESFTVTDTLNIFLSTNAMSFYPGEVLNVFGDIQTELSSLVSSAVLEISLDDTTFSTSLDQGKFTQDLMIPSDITTGTHTLKVTARDNYGNTGESTLDIEILPFATSIDITSSNTTLFPKDQFTIFIYLYDQTKELMLDTITLEIYNSDDNLVSERTLLSGESITYQIPQFAPPGLWTIFASYSSISDSSSFTISEVQSLDYELIDNLLYLTNTGNVKYTEDLNITIDGVDQDYLIYRTKNLDPNETITIDLTDELPSGSYTLAVPTGFGTINEPFEIINGKSVSSLTWLYTILAIIFLGLLSYAVYARIHPKKQLATSKKIDDKKIKEHKIKLYDSKKEKEKKKSSLVFEDKQQGLEDFKHRTLEEIKRTEEKINKDTKNKAFISEGKLGYVTGRNDPQKSEPKEKFSLDIFNE